MGKKSKQKGHGYERRISNLLTKWWQKKFPEEEFNRVPQSGGLRWKDQEKVGGDIVTPELFPYNIECKKRENWTFEQLLKGTGEVLKWWEQSVKDAKRVGKKPMLIFSKNYFPDLVMIEYEEFMNIFSKKVTYIYLNNGLVVFLFEEILKINPKYFRVHSKYAKRHT